MKRLMFCLILLTFAGSSFTFVQLGPVAINLFRVGFGFFVMAFLIYMRPQNLRFQGQSFYKKLLFAMVFILMMTYPFVYSIPAWVEGTIFLVINVTLMFFVVMYTESVDDVNFYMKAYAIGLLINMIIAVYEYRTQVHIIDSNYLSAYDVNSWEYSSLVKAPTALLYNPNNVGVAVLLGLPFVGAFKNKKKETLPGIVKYSWFVLCAYVALATGSRGSILFVLIGVLGYSVLERIRVSKKFFGLIAVVGLAIVVVYMNIDFIMEQLEYSGLSKQGGLIDETIDNSRIRNIIGGLKASKNNLFLGRGPLHAERALFEETGRYFAMHNFWIEWLVTMGVPGMLCFLALYIRCLRKMFKSKIYQSKLVLVSLLMFFPASMIPPTVVTLNFVWIIFGFAIAIEKLDANATEMVNVESAGEDKS